MSDPKRKAKKGEFVVSLKQEDGDAEDGLRKAEGLVVEAIDELPRSYVVRAKQDDELTRGALRKIVGEHGTITPVLEDEDGHTLIPSGRINVIMSGKLSKSKLDAWSEKHRVDVVQHSKWRPKSVLLEPKSGDEDALEASERLRDDPDVELAEPDVLAPFKRE